jgi:hypothetical protein
MNLVLVFKNYAIDGSMLTDLLGVIPTLVYDNSPATYGFKVLRFLKVG